VGGSYEFLRNGARLLDARTQWHYIATGVSPAMAHPQVGAGSVYACTVHDATGALLDGGKTYRLHVDPRRPAKDFWAVDVYDTQTRSLLQVPSTIYPAVASNSGDLQANNDGSYDLYFGPTAPEGKEPNWVETIPGKSWFQLFRLYGPLQPGSTRPGSSTSSSRSTDQTGPRTLRGATRRHRRSNLPGLRPAPATAGACGVPGLGRAGVSHHARNLVTRSLDRG
jgi:Protein of unknown function (DUF1214)